MLAFVVMVSALHSPSPSVLRWSPKPLFLVPMSCATPASNTNGSPDKMNSSVVLKMLLEGVT